MSFRELAGRDVPTSLRLDRQRSSSSKNVRGGVPSPSASNSNNTNQKDASNSKPRRPMLVLHGRVQSTSSSSSPARRSSRKSQVSPNLYNDRNRTSNGNGRNNSARGANGSSVRAVMERKSEFSILSRETQIFGRMVSDLEELLADSGDSPEAAWRARILMRSTQETDKELWEKLFQYEKSLNGGTVDAELRKAQTACMKLHRDFKRIHKSLILTLSKFETRQKAEISRLGAVGWTAPKIDTATPERMGFSEDEDDLQEQADEDYFDRAIREREEFDASMRAKELSEINRKMHTVNNIYNDLAEMVDEQQEMVDDLEENIDYADYNVQAQQRDPSIMDVFSCGGLESTLETTGNFRSSRNPGEKGDDTFIDWAPLLACGDDIAVAAESLKESYGIMREQDNNPLVRYTQTDSDDDSPVAVEPLTVDTNGRHRSTDSNVSPTARLRQNRNGKSPHHQNTKERDSLRISEEFHWMMPFETLAEDVKAVHSDLVGWGQNIVTPRYEQDQIPSPHKRMF